MNNNNKPNRCFVCGKKEGTDVPSMRMFKLDDTYFCDKCFPTSEKVIKGFNRKQGW